MAFTTQNISDLGIVFDDAAFHSNAILYIPDPAGPHPVVGGGARPIFIGTHSPHYSGSADLSTQGKAMTTFCNAGWVGLAFAVRSLVPFNGQVTTGKWPQQSADFHKVVHYVRTQLAADFPILGSLLNFVGGAGPSGAASHAMTCTLEGTVGDDRLDFCIACSAAVDFANREGNTSSGFITKSAEYADLGVNDFVNLRARSPIALITSDDKNVMHINGDAENMPAHQLLDSADEFAITANYLSIFNTGTLGTQHGYAYWEAIAPQALTFAAARLAEFNGSEPPPPPVPTGRVKVTALITNLAPSQELTLNVAAHDITSGLDGPSTPFVFTSDQAGTVGGKTAPVGNYVLVDATDGVPSGDITTRAWWGYAYVDGAILPTSWAHLNPTSKTSFNWIETDAFLAACNANGKLGGISVDCGIKSPPWIYANGRVEQFFESGPNAGTIPLIWDLDYEGQLKNFIKQFATRYDANVGLSYIVVGGLGQLLDCLTVQTADYAAYNALAVTTGFPDAITGWTVGAARILDSWSKGFATTKVFMAIELPVPSTNGGLTGIDQFTRDSIQRYKTKMGVMNLNLDGATAAGPDLSLASIIRDSTQTSRAYQFRRPSSDPACDPTQEPVGYNPELGLRNAANAGITLGVQFEEFYESDILTVAAPYPADFTQFQIDLTANAI